MQALGLNQPPIKWVQRATSTAVLRSGSEDQHSPQSSADIKNYFIASTM